jgi:hypothetical protein
MHFPVCGALVILPRPIHRKFVSMASFNSGQAMKTCTVQETCTHESFTYRSVLQEAIVVNGGPSGERGRMWPASARSTRWPSWAFPQATEDCRPDAA